jgi:hypothetical protein
VISGGQAAITILKETFMESEQIEVVFLELKYCELCGGLWLRAKDSAEVYCESCAEQMYDFPAIGVHHRRRRRMRLAQELEIDSTEGNRMVVVCTEGGNA